jgi:hypothetical protein
MLAPIFTGIAYLGVAALGPFLVGYLLGYRISMRAHGWAVKK